MNMANKKKNYFKSADLFSNDPVLYSLIQPKRVDTGVLKQYFTFHTKSYSDVRTDRQTGAPRSTIQG